MPVTLAEAKRALKEAQWEGPPHLDADNYATTHKTRYRTNSGDPLAIEPADPFHVDHEKRRKTRLAPIDYEGLAKPFYECGCGDCTDAVDPLADDTEPFRDVLKAAEACPNPRPVTVEKARKIYLAYQHAAWKDPTMTSTLERTQSHHGKLLGAERHILSELDDPTLIFLSLRLSPIEVENGHRRWIFPSILGDRLGDAWQNVWNVLSYQLKDYRWEYATIIGMTDSAATPHRHVAIYVEDPNDEVGIGIAKSAVKSHVNNCKGAYPEDHPVEPDQRDAGIVFHEIPKADEVSDERLIEISETRGEQSFSRTSIPLYYMANQQPHWALKNVYDGESEINSDSIDVDGAAIAWALPWRECSSSENFVDEAIRE